MRRFGMIVAMQLLGVGAACGSKDCSQCTPTCVNGIETMCLVLDPPGCGEQAGTQTCSHGCSDAGPYCYQLPDAGQ